MTLKEKLRWHYHKFLKIHYPFLWSRHLSRVLLGKHTNFKKPLDLNEKIQWLMFYTNTDIWPLLADKYRVRKYVEERIGNKYLIPLLDHWDNADNIEFDKLPMKFVMKPNNGSYDTIICTNKADLDIEKTRSKLKHSLTHKFGYENAEPHYNRIVPHIVMEELLECDEPGGLIDYKIWCFNGKPHCIFVCANRDNINHSTNFVCYDLNWVKLDHYISEKFKNNFECPKPHNLDEMLKIASKLSDGLPQARIDLYNIKGQIFFGEITLSSNFGMMTYFTKTALDEMGKLTILPTRGYKEKINTFAKRWLPSSK